MSEICRVPSCIALASQDGYCAAHRSMDPDALTVLVGMLALRDLCMDGPVEPPRIEWDAEGRPVKFYPRTR